MRRRPLARGWLAAVAMFAVLTPGLGRAQEISRERVARFAPDVWVTLRDFRQVTAVAAADRVAYLGTTAGVERFDTLRGSWLAPVTEADGLPDDRVTALAADPAGDAWIGTRRGLVRLLAFTGEIELVWGPPPARVEAVAVDPRAGDVYARIAGGWWGGRAGANVLERLSGPPPAGLAGSVPVDALDPVDLPWTDPLYVDSPAVRGARFRLTVLDRDLRGDFYVGTWGDNGRRWGAGGQRWEPLYFGLAGPAGGPVVPTATGYWFLPGAGATHETRTELGFDASGRVYADLDLGVPAPPAAARASTDLASWSYVHPGRTQGLITAVAEAGLALGDTLYLGTGYGLTQGIGERWTHWGFADAGLGPVAALAADGALLWLGTDHGLIAWRRSDATPEARLLPGRRVTAVLPLSDALFVGTESGLFAGPRTGALPDGLPRVETRGRAVRALAARGSTVYVATDAGLEIFDRVRDDWRYALLGEGRLTAPPLALAVDAEQVWIGTADGLVRWREATDEWRTYYPADGLAGAPVRHLLAEPGAVWASTPHGVSRFTWSATHE
ncbi:MAG: two-component regulator propeller domain-containing protein [Gemmatimonadota bacterium]